MVSGRRLVSVWFALHLSVGIGLMGMTSAVFDRPALSPGVPLLVGAVVAFIAAVVLLREYPELQSGVVWRFSLLTAVVFVLGNVLARSGIYAPTGEGSPLTIAVIWLTSMAVGYWVTAGRESARV